MADKDNSSRKAATKEREKKRRKKTPRILPPLRHSLRERGISSRLVGKRLGKTKQIKVNNPETVELVDVHIVSRAQQIKMD